MSAVIAAHARAAAPLAILPFVLTVAIACERSEDHRADTTVGPTPVGTAGIAGVPPRPTRSPRPDIPFWRQDQALEVARRVQLDPLPDAATVLTFNLGVQLRFTPEREAGLEYICPQMDERIGALDKEIFATFIRTRFESAGYQRTVAIIPLRQDDYRGQSVYEALSPDRSHVVKVLLIRSDPLNDHTDDPYVFWISWEQRCNG